MSLPNIDEPLPDARFLCRLVAPEFEIADGEAIVLSALGPEWAVPQYFQNRNDLLDEGILSGIRPVEILRNHPNGKGPPDPVIVEDQGGWLRNHAGFEPRP